MSCEYDTRCKGMGKNCLISDNFYEDIEQDISNNEAFKELADRLPTENYIGISNNYKEVCNNGN